METHHHEWILTNRLGGYALGTGNLINQRKYHGILIAGDVKLNRNHLVAGIEEKVEWRGETIHLDSNNYSNCIYPEGFMHLVKPWLRPYPAFLYSALPHQDEILILKEIMMDDDSNTIMVRYTNLGTHRLHFDFHPKFTLNQHHDINPHGSLDFAEFDLDLSTKEDYSLFSARRQENGIEVFGACLKGHVTNNRYVYYNVYYPWEVMSGYEGIGDQISLFEIAFDLAHKESNVILFSDAPIQNPQKMILKIVDRYKELPRPSDFPCETKQSEMLLGELDYDDNNLFDRQDYLKILKSALMDFVVADDIVAGYPYYGPWGRDTMVVLNALLHSGKENLDTVERILSRYSRQIKNGLISNMSAETGRDANYDSIDATLWYIILLWKLGKIKESKVYWKEVIHLTEDILQSILNYPDHPFEVRPDGLIELKSTFAHGTWMDVRIEGKAVTPRWGAPVEINALWYNALCSYEAMCKSYSSVAETYPAHKEYVLHKERVHSAFDKFWTGEFLADRLEGDKPIIEIRPNAIIALSLPWSISSQEIMQKVFERSNQELYTPYGIRTLSPRDPRFRKKYYGTQQERDLSYHNGSVWAWLLGPFCGLYLKLNQGRKKDSQIISDLGDYIATLRRGFMKGHIASVAEVWDGEKPHFPKGAPAQAWSVAALYNVESYICSLEKRQ